MIRMSRTELEYGEWSMQITWYLIRKDTPVSIINSYASRTERLYSLARPSIVIEVIYVNIFNRLGCEVLAFPPFKNQTMFLFHHGHLRALFDAHVSVFDEIVQICFVEVFHDLSASGFVIVGFSEKTVVTSSPQNTNDIDLHVPVVCWEKISILPTYFLRQYESQSLSSNLFANQIWLAFARIPLPVSFELLLGLVYARQIVHVAFINFRHSAVLPVVPGVRFTSVREHDFLCGTTEDAYLERGKYKPVVGTELLCKERS